MRCLRCHLLCYQKKCTHCCLDLNRRVDGILAKRERMHQMRRRSLLRGCYNGFEGLITKTSARTGTMASSGCIPRFLSRSSVECDDGPPAVAKRMVLEMASSVLRASSSLYQVSRAICLLRVDAVTSLPLFSFPSS